MRNLNPGYSSLIQEKGILGNDKGLTSLHSRYLLSSKGNKFTTNSSFYINFTMLLILSLVATDSVFWLSKISLLIYIWVKWVSQRQTEVQIQELPDIMVVGVLENRPPSISSETALFLSIS